MVIQNANGQYLSIVIKSAMSTHKLLKSCANYYT